MEAVANDAKVKTDFPNNFIWLFYYLIFEFICRPLEPFQKSDVSLKDLHRLDEVLDMYGEEAKKKQKQKEEEEEKGKDDK